MTSGWMTRGMPAARSLTLILLFSLMSAGQIGAVLDNRARKGASAQTLYNLGFELYYQHGFYQRQMMENLAQAYASAQGTTEKQNLALERAAAYWARELANFDSAHIPGQYLPGGKGSRIKPPQYYKDPQLMKMYKAPQ